MDYTKEIFDFIAFNEEEFICYIHRTKTCDTAKLIINNGFEFAEAILKTTDELSNDIVVLKYLYNMRKEYGKFNIIICIANKIYDKYLYELKKLSKEMDYTVEEIITDVPSRFEEDRDQTIHTLPKQYIKGFFCEETYEIVRNNNFNPYYDSPKFLENIERLKKN